MYYIHIFLTSVSTATVTFEAYIAEHIEQKRYLKQLKVYFLYTWFWCTHFHNEPLTVLLFYKVVLG